MDVTRGEEVGGDPCDAPCALARVLISELRSPLAAVRMGAELLIRSDLSERQSQRVARNVLAATMRLEDLLSDLALQLTDAANNEQQHSPAIAVECPRGICMDAGS
jgi:nitrogen-specific signal transduction histidine kinase